MMEWVITITIGLLFGSFATLASYRLPRGGKIGMTRSACTSCSHPLGVLDLVPVYSWVFARGKCRYCGATISARYPLTELLMALCFALVYLQFGWSMEALALYALAVLLVILVVIDLEWKIIPDSLQIALLIVGIFYAYVVERSLWDVFFAGLIFFLLSYGLRGVFFWWKKKEALGMGDVKFFAVLGCYIDIYIFISFLFFAGIFGVVLSLIWRALGKGEEFPFGPALALSLFMLLLYPKADLVGLIGFSW